MPSKISTEVLDNGIKAPDLKLLEEWGKYLVVADQEGKAVTTSQLRKVFGAIKTIQADFENQKGEIILLHPKLAYAVGREKNNAGKQGTKLEKLYDLLSPLIYSVNEDKKKFNNLVKITEAIVAYHKAYDGK